jgi:uncharacterized membrane protein
LQNENTYKQIIHNFVLSSSLFSLSFFIAWQISAASNFFYSTWYEVLDLDQAISRYAPNNNFKKGFENTNKQQRVELFSGIVDAIQNGGEGLRQLIYTDNKTKITDTLLTDAEIIHLEDVAHFVNKFKILAIFGLFIAFVSFVLMRMSNVPIARLKSHLLSGLGVIIIITILIFTFGPTKIFYLGHELLFPNNHQWFFFYEDSLMSTMMKAPALFGPIACQLLLLTILLWLAGIIIFRKAQSKLKKCK